MSGADPSCPDRTAAVELLGGFLLLALFAGAGYRGLAWPLGFLLQSLAVFAALAFLLLWLIPPYLPGRRFGIANRITLLRAGMTALLAGLIGHADTVAEHGWLVSMVALTALLLDGVDGWLARRGHLQSAFGARFDMETDAFLIVILSLLVFQSGKAGSWVLLSGALRYIFRGAGLALPRLRRPLPPSKRRQTLCVVQTVALIACLNPLVRASLAGLMAALALLLLLLSFGVDTLWLLRRTPQE